MKEIEQVDSKKESYIEGENLSTFEEILERCGLCLKQRVLAYWWEDKLGLQLCSYHLSNMKKWLKLSWFHHYISEEFKATRCWLTKWVLELLIIYRSTGLCVYTKWEQYFIQYFGEERFEILIVFCKRSLCFEIFQRFLLFCISLTSRSAILNTKHP